MSSLQLFYPYYTHFGQLVQVFLLKCFRGIRCMVSDGVIQKPLNKCLEIVRVLSNPCGVDAFSIFIQRKIYEVGEDEVIYENLIFPYCIFFKNMQFYTVKSRLYIIKVPICF